MRIHRILAEAAAALLRRVFEGRVLDRELDQLFRENPRWGKRDRGFVAETVFEVTRWRRAFAFLADDDSLEAACAVQWQRAGLEVPDWWPARGSAGREGELAAAPRAVRESIPDWLDEAGAAELGDDWDGILAALNNRAPVFLRVNRLKGDVPRALEWLASHGIEATTVAGAPDALMLPPGKMLPKPLAQEGIVEIQDAGSQQIAPLLQVEPGMKVIDACAGSGGKALHFAALMQSRGEILALDVSAGKLTELRRRAGRAGTRIIRTETWREDTLRRFAQWADRVIIDAPCSGLGTLRRQPDLKWRLSQKALEKTRRLQRQMLDHYPDLLRPGGKFVYATCSVLPSENGGQIRNLLERGKSREVETELTVTPADSGPDGFYAARLSGG